MITNEMMHQLFRTVDGLDPEQLADPATVRVRLQNELIRLSERGGEESPGWDAAEHPAAHEYIEVLVEEFCPVLHAG